MQGGVNNLQRFVLEPFVHDTTIVFCNNWYNHIK